MCCYVIGFHKKRLVLIYLHICSSTNSSTNGKNPSYNMLFLWMLSPSGTVGGGPVGPWVFVISPDADVTSVLTELERSVEASDVVTSVVVASVIVVVAAAVDIRVVVKSGTIITESKPEQFIVYSFPDFTVNYSAKHN